MVPLGGNKEPRLSILFSFGGECHSISRSSFPPKRTLILLSRGVGVRVHALDIFTSLRCRNPMEKLQRRYDSIPYSLDGSTPALLFIFADQVVPLYSPYLPSTDHFNGDGAGKRS